MKLILSFFLSLLSLNLFAADGALGTASGTTTVGTIPAGNLPALGVAYPAALTNNSTVAWTNTDNITALTFSGAGSGQGILQLSNAAATGLTVILGPSNAFANVAFFSNSIVAPFWKDPTNAPTSNDVMTATSTSGDTAWKAPAPSSGTFNPRTTVHIYDDFIGGIDGTGTVGELGWSFVNGSVGSVAAIANRPGLKQLISSASANQVNAYYLNLGVVDILPVMTNSVMSLHFAITCNEVTSSNIVRFGICNSVTTDPPDGFWIAVTNTTGAGTFYGNICSGGAVTSTSLATTAVAGTYHDFGIQFDGLGNTTFYVDGVQKGSALSAGSPNTGGRICVQIRPNEAVAHHATIDYMDFSLTVTR